MSKADNLSPFIKIGKNDLTPATPRLFLEMKAKPELSLTLPYKIEFILRRAKKDGSNRPCIFRWSPDINGFSPSGLILLRHADSSDSDGGLETCDVNHPKPLKFLSEDSILVDGQNAHLCELAPGGEARFTASLPARYYQALRAGEMYTVLYPGSEVAMWDWGTIKEHLGKEMKARAALMIPGGARVSFTVRAEEAPWPGRSGYEAQHGFEMANLAEQQWRRDEARKGMRIIEGWPAPFGPEDRVPGAPILTVELKCAPTISLMGEGAVTVKAHTYTGQVCAVKLKVTYTGQVCGPNGPASHTATTRPITFRSWSVVAGLHEDVREGFDFFRRRGGSGSSSEEQPWEPCDVHEEGCEGFQIYDGPDVAVRVVEDEDFTTLQPGESWTTTRYLHSPTRSHFPADTAVGDVFLYGFCGAWVEWWDWGGAEEHADTVVMLPCWIAGRVVDPRDNGRRPKLIVPHAEPVEFRIVE
ncbi:hypothetical protein QBC40DRAFT_272628 [Triangularia verruculosa]|uniref:Uncharacterized protein n=1 Tax=Triangularia verruculosa TaxID=2587418 RepID=A0AAN6XQF9_9PEZI|nr:hypothetical protein QBC40DRAFT_272628 [Triangularia verruculosa]